MRRAHRGTGGVSGGSVGERRADGAHLDLPRRLQLQLGQNVLRLARRRGIDITAAVRVVRLGRGELARDGDAPRGGRGGELLSRSANYVARHALLTPAPLLLALLCQNALPLVAKGAGAPVRGRRPRLTLVACTGGEIKPSRAHCAPRRAQPHPAPTQPATHLVSSPLRDAAGPRGARTGAHPSPPGSLQGTRSPTRSPPFCAPKLRGCRHWSCPRNHLLS